MRDQALRAGGVPGLDAGSPNSDGPGNRAWREARARLAIVQAAEMQARRN